MDKTVIAHLATLSLQAQFSDKDGAAFACMAFRDNWTQAIPGIEMLMTANQPHSGFDAVAYWHSSSRQVIVVCRGTDGFTSQKDWIASVSQALRTNAGQIPDAFDFLQNAWALAMSKHAPDGLFLAGTSLGGGLIDGLAVYARSLLSPRDFGGRTIKAIGTASAGFAKAFETYAQQNGLTQTLTDRATHYVRAADFVPGHPLRNIFGVDVEIASIYHGIMERPHKSDNWLYDWTSDMLENHRHALYFEYFTVPGTNHIWRNSKGIYSIEPGSQPGWNRSAKRPKNF
ncbi:hypothetical protein [Asticcacaulis excentricus]|uniref:hypothetical protein n=1 Tax=Asticcacaulis excentricus TaxID=78587 RepID=UPI000F832F44|nr:hypothetical protein [Asticcacaulis excentricus]